MIRVVSIAKFYHSLFFKYMVKFEYDGSVYEIGFCNKDEDHPCHEINKELLRNIIENEKHLPADQRHYGYTDPIFSCFWEHHLLEADKSFEESLESMVANKLITLM